ncbi:MAG: M56 family metallopeptidase [Fuerstiella sp.]|nr:M56 family metallopeptidase [Fuerstiella sp.]
MMCALPVVNLLVIDPPVAGSGWASVIEVDDVSLQASGEAPSDTVAVADLSPIKSKAAIEPAGVAGTPGDEARAVAVDTKQLTGESRLLHPLLLHSIFWLWLWLAGAALLSAWHIAGWLLSRQLRRDGSPPHDDVVALTGKIARRLRVHQSISVRQTFRVTTPMVVGWIKPVIVLPANALLGLSPIQLEAVLAHELAHIKRHDYLVNLIQTIVETLLFYHPAVWWLSHQIRSEREFCADDLAVRICQQRNVYARSLVALAEMVHDSPARAVAATGGDLLFRIRRIVHLSDSQSMPSRYSGPSALAAVLASVSLGVVLMAMAQAQPSGDRLFSNTTDAVSKAEPAISSGGHRDAMKATTINQFGIRWTFDKEYQCGQFANGDWWVVGPIRIITIDPPSVTKNNCVLNGSMINPSPRDGTYNGYDSRINPGGHNVDYYRPDLNVAYGISRDQPLEVRPHSSVVSVISQGDSRPEPKSSGDQRSRAKDSRRLIKTAAILTVLETPAAEGCFRPAYCGQVKDTSLNANQINYDLLRRLRPVAGTPRIEEVERVFERPWLDHIPDWHGRQLYPIENMPDYGREVALASGTASLMLNLDLPDQQKKMLLVRYIQFGIDLFGITKDGGDRNWISRGAHNHGRKWPILFAGMMLDFQPMKGIGDRREIAFQEDDGTFYVSETRPGVINGGFGGFTLEHLGMPEWGVRHALDPEQDDVAWDARHRSINSGSCAGFVLAAHVMGATELWNHQALFDYQDRWMFEMSPAGRQRADAERSDGLARARASDRFHEQMWDAYRADYDTRWQHTPATIHALSQ